MSDQQLRTALNFDESDLGANRAGRLTPRQTKVVSRSEQLDTIISVSMGIFFLLVALVFSYGPVSNLLAHGFPPASLSADDTKGLAIVGGLWLVMGLLAVAYFIKAFKKTDRAVLKTQGKASFAKVEKRIENSDGSLIRNELHYDMHVGGVRFNEINEKLMEFIEPNTTYVFYYVEGVGILSGESVG